MKQTKYYLEFLCEWQGDQPYYAQTSWCDTIEDVKKLFKKIYKFIKTTFDYECFTEDFKCEVMYAECDINEDYFEYGDIDIYGRIFMNEKGKVVIK